jgi:DNA-binding transcriptional regulator YiaG
MVDRRFAQENISVASTHNEEKLDWRAIDSMSGQELKKFRESKLRMSRSEFSHQMGIVVKTVYNWEEQPIIPKIVELAIHELLREINAKPGTRG